MERLGFLARSFTRTKPGAIWLHAVSVGEVTSALPLLRSLRENQPSVNVYLSTATVAGRKAAMQRASALVNGVFYCPLDFVSCVRRVLRTLKPSLLIVLETEIWPNLYSECNRCGARLAIVNGRISSRTWPHYRSWRGFFRPIMRLVDLAFVQSVTDRDRYDELGVYPTRLQIGPNLKYDASFAHSAAEIKTFGADQVWIAASTVGANERGSLRKHFISEEEIVLDAFQSLARGFPRLLLIIAPRQPSRFDEVAQKLKAAGVRFARQTSLKANSSLELELPGVLLLDTLGELASAYRKADVSFVGGSLAPRGGHNILEAAVAGSSIVIGPHMENFEAIARDFRQAEALVQIQRQKDLLPAIRELLDNPDRRRELAGRARRLVEAHRGSSRQIADRLWMLYWSASTKPVRNALTDSFLLLLAAAWRRGGEWKRRRYLHSAVVSPPLGVPVISIGGITMGGSGKTPFTTYLAAKLNAGGYAPAILTRGYLRRSAAKNLVFAPGSKIPPPITGDEAQIFLRAGVAPVGIGTNRYETAKLLLRHFSDTGVLLLDDGFQHARIARAWDIVVIDGLDPFGGEDVVPVGRLREPLEALGRAHAFVVTRAENDRRFQAIRERLRDFNSSAPVFRTHLRAGCWRDYRTGAALPDMRDRRVAAFCGLGNPENFWRTLESLGMDIVFRWQFPDHHAYNPAELQRVAQQARLHGAEILVTTEKDRINCPNHLDRTIAALGLAWLEIEFELEDELRFLALLEAAIDQPDQVNHTGPLHHDKPLRKQKLLSDFG